MASWLGAIPAILVGGVGTLIVTGLWTRFFPELLNAASLTRRR